jgi:alanyl-tRNA synthetase
MHPLVPYLLGQPHPLGKRIVNCQKCFRTGDIEEVGDLYHLTLFEMLGNWSLGDYFKHDAILWSFEFLTGKNWLGLDPKQIYVSVFEGDKDASRDDESIAAWEEAFNSAGIQAEIASSTDGLARNHRIFTYGKDKNWWGPAGQTGPCGPDSEMFFDTLGKSDSSEHASGWQGEGPCHPNCSCGRFVEIWNDVFMEYGKLADGSYELLDQKNVDTGMGLERMTMVLQGVDNIYATDLFRPITDCIKKYATKEDERSLRIVADHLRAATFLLADGVMPSNVDQGYALRRHIRRAIRHGRQLGIEQDFCSDVAEVVIETYGERYPGLIDARETIHDGLLIEEQKFRRTLVRGLQEVEKLAKQPVVSGREVFGLFETYGFPLELAVEVIESNPEAKLAPEWKAEYQKAEKEHQDLSRKGAEQKFAGGLADHSAETTRLHTAAHLLMEALRRVLGDHVSQRGSNITKERLRLDFSQPEALTGDQIAEVERIVNKQIEEDLPVHFEEMTLDEAKKAGAVGVFEHKYGERVKVYFVGEPEREGGYFSIEICGGPHVTHTGELGKFRIAKESSSSGGVRRIRAVLE